MRSPTVTALVLILVLAAVVLLVGAFRSREPKDDTRRKKQKQKQHQQQARRKSKPRSTTAVPERPQPKPDEALPSLSMSRDDDLEITKVSLPTLGLDDEDTDTGITTSERVVPIVFDEDAAEDEPTSVNAFILVSAVGQSDVGRKRRRNEDSWLMLDSPPLFVVADGMGGYAGGDVASALCVTTIADNLQKPSRKRVYMQVPRRADELAQAVELANRAIHEHAQANIELKDMGTTVVCARFSPNKQRVYIAHVGDSRCYVLRDGVLHQITTDHTAESLGVQGPMGSILIRALGVKKRVVVDVIIGKPRAGDRYLLCSDGLTKMVEKRTIETILNSGTHPRQQVDELVEAANSAGGKDNITAVVVRVDPTGAHRQG